MRPGRLGPAALLALGGCGLFYDVPSPRPVNHWLAEDGDLANVHRVMVLPFHQVAGVHADVRKLRDVFVGELMELQRFEVVPLPEGAHDDRLLRRSIAHGRVSSAGVVALADRYGLDGVITGTITSWRPYKPPRLGLRVQLTSLHAGTVVWASEGYYDASDARTAEDMRHYSCTELQDSDNLHGWEMHLISPTMFATFVSHRIVGTWRSAAGVR